jgi:hypothetical protein
VDDIQGEYHSERALVKVRSLPFILEPKEAAFVFFLQDPSLVQSYCDAVVYVNCGQIDPYVGFILKGFLVLM